MEGLKNDVFLLKRQLKELNKDRTRNRDMIDMLVKVLENHDIKWWEKILEE